jgi:hypothetical protein
VASVPFFLCQLGAFCAYSLYLSFFEWAFHRYAFHTPKVNRSMFRAHTLVHHQVYKGDGSYHTHDEHPDHVPMNWWALPAMLGAHLPLFFLIQWVTGVPSVWGGALAVCAYFGVYESIHWAMHVPRAARVLGRLRAYRFLDAHHRAHHKHLLSNLNVVLPLADLVLGTLRAADGRRVRCPWHAARPHTGPAAHGARRVWAVTRDG